MPEILFKSPIPRCDCLRFLRDRENEVPAAARSEAEAAADATAAGRLAGSGTVGP